MDNPKGSEQMSLIVPLGCVIYVTSEVLGNKLEGEGAFQLVFSPEHLSLWSLR